MESTIDRSKSRVGQRVACKSGDELGIVVDVNNHGVVKVKWDRGRTSYYHPKMPANLKLAGADQNDMRLSGKCARR
jgi:hypothetical protein